MILSWKIRTSSLPRFSGSCNSRKCASRCNRMWTWFLCYYLQTTGLEYFLIAFLPDWHNLKNLTKGWEKILVKGKKNLENMFWCCSRHPTSLYLTVSTSNFKGKGWRCLDEEDDVWVEIHKERYLMDFLVSFYHWHLWEYKDDSKSKVGAKRSWKFYSFLYKIFGCI